MADRKPLIQRISPLARRIAADLGADPRAVQDALKGRAPGMLSVDVHPDELSRDQYDDLLDAVESELRARGRLEG